MWLFYVVQTVGVATPCEEGVSRFGVLGILDRLFGVNLANRNYWVKISYILML